MGIDFTLIIPETFLAVSSLLLLILGVFQGEKRAPFLYKIAIFVLILTYLQLTQLNFVDEVGTAFAMNNLFVLDSFAIFMKSLILLAAALVLILSYDFACNHSLGTKKKVIFEFPILILLAVVGMMVMVSANDLMSLYMGLELQSLSLYVLTAMNRDSEKSTEAGLKYFILGALSSGLLLYGASLIYGFAGTTNFTELASLYSGGNAELPIGVLIGMVLVITAICFKVSAVPFHMWTPDVYEGANKCVTAFFATAPKVAAIALFVRFTAEPFGNFVGEWQQILIFVSIASMLVGAFGALKQTNIKRLMAYSSIGHVGYLLIGIATGTVAGIHAVLVYIAIYVVMSIGAFACIIMMKRKDTHVENINDLAGLAKYRPAYAMVFAVLMFSMAGIPPIAGFFGKFFVLKAALDSELYTLAIVGIISSIVAAFYYLRIVKIMYFDSEKDLTGDENFSPVLGGNLLDSNITCGMKMILVGTGLFNLLFFIFPTPLIEAAKVAAATLF